MTPFDQAGRRVWELCVGKPVICGEKTSSEDKSMGRDAA